MIENGSYSDQVLIVDSKKTLSSYLLEQRDSEVDKIVAAIEKTGYDYIKLVQHYCRILGATKKVVDGCETKLDETEWDNLMEDCGYTI